MFTLTIVATELWAKLRKRPAGWPSRREWLIVVSLDLLTFTAGFITGGAV